MVLIAPVEAERKLFPDTQLFARYVKLDPIAWAPELYQQESIREETQQTVFHSQRTMLFDVDIIALPTATSRWKVSLPGHPETTFDDLRTGKWPKPTEEEIDARCKAMELARGIRAQLDIRPLTTSTIIRQLREGTMKEHE
ncbi:MAG: hypothetical protein OEW82_04765 [Dehalococcoidia bacterium]|nr:hypothetical protein [Dehalococcoidia bacterium]